MTTTEPAHDWRDRAACRDEDPELFFPSSDDQDPYALTICESCPVRAACAAGALDADERWGIRAGVRLNPKRLYRNRARLQKIAAGVDLPDDAAVQKYRKRKAAVRSLAETSSRQPGPTVDGIRHGTSSGYNYHHCRCVQCRAWNTIGRRERRARTAS